MRKIIFELCVETMNACLAARAGGADRIELCSGLSEGGLTPSHGFVREAVQRSGLPVHVLVRPQAGTYVYSADEVALMKEDVTHIKSLGAAGIVIGLLQTDGSIDLEAIRMFVGLSRPMAVTFHRAFDSTPSLDETLEQVIAAGCDRVLTSGGCRDVMRGADVLAALVAQAGDRIDVAVGGGLRLQNAATLARVTGATHFHGSLRPEQPRDKRAIIPGTDEGYSAARVLFDPETVRKIVKRLQEA